MAEDTESGYAYHDEQGTRRIHGRTRETTTKRQVPNMKRSTVKTQSYVRRGILFAVLFVLASSISSPTVAPAAKRDVFAATMRVHFRAAETCWKQKRVPDRKTVEREIVAIQKAAKRWWPHHPQQAEMRLMTLMLTEGGGNKEGAKSDPNRRSYGPLHIKYEEALISAQTWKIGKPFIDMKKKGAVNWFKSRLRDNVEFGIFCAAGFLKICDDEAGGDEQRGLLIYKCGSGKFKKLVAARLRNGKSLNTISVWKHYMNMNDWVECLRNQVIRNMDHPCECLKSK